MSIVQKINDLENFGIYLDNFNIYLDNISLKKKNINSNKKKDLENLNIYLEENLGKPLLVFLPCCLEVSSAASLMASWRAECNE